MPNDTEDLKELVQATSIQLSLNQDAVEKDFYVTKAIQVLTQVEDDYFTLVFQGGTSLSKGYQIIRRLSEDVDFRVVQKPQALTLGKEVRRKKLREFRHHLIHALKEAEFEVPKDTVKVFYEGRFMRIQAAFPGSGKLTYLRPYIAVECFLGDLALNPQTTEITTLIKLTLGESCNHTIFPVNCVALDETAAEKWVALTRRVANTQLRTRKSDQHLVRHLYDLYHLKISGLLTGDYCEIISRVMEKDSLKFKKHNLAYADDPINTSALALSLLNDSQWQTHWDRFLEHMVYENTKPSFHQAYNQLQILSQEIFDRLKQPSEIN